MKVILSYSDWENLSQDLSKEEFITRLNSARPEEKTAFNLIHYLLERKSFLSVWRALDTKIQNEIFEDMKKIIEKNSDKIICEFCRGSGEIFHQDFYSECSCLVNGFK